MVCEEKNAAMFDHHPLFDMTVIQQDRNSLIGLYHDYYIKLHIDESARHLCDSFGISSVLFIFLRNCLCPEITYG